MKFEPMPKTPRFRRDIVVTEKIDGTNACILISEPDQYPGGWGSGAVSAQLSKEHNLWCGITAASRTRLICPTDDNFGFARWVWDNAVELTKLGPGAHFGEWWGGGIQRGYGLPKGEKRFSLFNTYRWGDPEKRPSCCSVVPTLYSGPMSEEAIAACLEELANGGSLAQQGFDKPEGICIYHTSSKQIYKITLEGDQHKGKSG